MLMSMNNGDSTIVCNRCGRRLGNRAVITNAGPYCKQHADRLPPHLRRPAKPAPKAG